MTISKAEQKRQKQALESLTNKLNFVLVDFRERYLNSYVNWSIYQLECGLERSVERYNENPTQNNQVYVQRRQKQLSRKMSLTLEFATEASELYEIKLARVIQKLIDNGFDHRIQVSVMRTTGGDFEFLIQKTDQIQECHARVVFVNGAIKAPHYRFITTVRKIK